MFGLGLGPAIGEQGDFSLPLFEIATQVTDVEKKDHLLRRYRVSRLSQYLANRRIDGRKQNVFRQRFDDPGTADPRLHRTCVYRGKQETAAFQTGGNPTWESHHGEACSQGEADHRSGPADSSLPYLFVCQWSIH